MFFPLHSRKKCNDHLNFLLKLVDRLRKEISIVQFRQAPFNEFRAINLNESIDIGSMPERTLLPETGASRKWPFFSVTRAASYLIRSGVNVAQSIMTFPILFR
jgi:hypothetical protein